MSFSHYFICLKFAQFANFNQHLYLRVLLQVWQILPYEVQVLPLICQSGKRKKKKEKGQI